MSVARPAKVGEDHAVPAHIADAGGVDVQSLVQGGRPRRTSYDLMSPTSKTRWTAAVAARASLQESHLQLRSRTQGR
jgi:hypothetical protein